MAALRPLPPPYIMGLGFLPLGIYGAVLLITAPQLLAADHVPEKEIAFITAMGLSPTFLGFLVSPLLDWRYSRRTYALALTFIAALASFAALLSIHNPPVLTGFLFIGELAVALQIAAVGGWFGNIVDGDKKGALGAFFNVANAIGFGVTASIAIPLLRGLPYILGAGVLSVLVLTVLPVYWLMPCPPADGRLATESIRDFARDVGALLKTSSVLWTLFIFLLPVASFALTNTLGGLGRDFHTSEALVALLGGAGTTIAGAVGSLLVPSLGRIVPPRPLYLLVGIVGGLFTLVLAVLAHNPWTLGIALLGENLFQGAAFAVQFTIILRAVGRNNPLAATQFGLLNASAALPLVYMQIVDGNAYDLFGGVNGSYLADAGVSVLFCLVVGLVLWLCRTEVERADLLTEGGSDAPVAAAL